MVEILRSRRIISVHCRVECNGVTREAIGTAGSSKPGARSLAEHRAFTIAAALFADENDPFATGSERHAVSHQELPGTSFLSHEAVAGFVGNMITCGQLRLIRKLERSSGLSADRLSERLFGCETGELSRPAGAELIMRLESENSDKARV